MLYGFLRNDDDDLPNGEGRKRERPHEIITLGFMVSPVMDGALLYDMAPAAAAGREATRAEGRRWLAGWLAGEGSSERWEKAAGEERASSGESGRGT